MKSANTAVLAITQTFTAHSGRNTTRRRGSIFSQRGGSERLPGNGSPPGTRFLLAAKESSQRKLPLFRRSGPATWGLHAPKTPNKEVGRPTGYANAVLLFALNARALCSVSKFGSSPEPPQGGEGGPLVKGGWLRSGLGDSDGLCVAARYPRRRPGIPPPRLRSAPPFDKGGFLRGASGTPPTFLVKKLTAQILRFSACKSAPYVVQYRLTKYGKNRRNSKWNTAIRS